LKRIGFLAVVAVLALGGSAAAADLGIERGLAAGPSGWEGAYIGAHVGYGPGSLTDLGLFGAELEAELGGGPTAFSGVFAGGQAGYNFATGDRLVFGVEGDASWSNESGSQSLTAPFGGGPPGTFTSATRLNWTGDLTAHAGYDLGSFMPYILAGAAFANNTYGFSESGGGLGSSLDVSTSTTHVGYTLGAGVGAMLSDHVSGFVEGRYADYGIASYTFSAPAGFPTSSLTEPASLTDASVRTGLNWHY
jgi:outer membrane immunogenic protein